MAQSRVTLADIVTLAKKLMAAGYEVDEAAWDAVCELTNELPTRELEDLALRAFPGFTPNMLNCAFSDCEHDSYGAVWQSALMARVEEIIGGPRYHPVYGEDDRPYGPTLIQNIASGDWIDVQGVAQRVAFVERRNPLSFIVLLSGTELRDIDTVVRVLAPGAECAPSVRDNTPGPGALTIYVDTDGEMTRNFACSRSPTRTLQTVACFRGRVISFHGKTKSPKEAGDEKAVQRDEEEPELQPQG